MPPSPEVREAELDHLQVVRFRRHVLFRAGYEWEDAKAVARQTDVDWHYAVKLMEQGCSSRTARRIVL